MSLETEIPPAWRDKLRPVTDTDAFRELEAFLKDEWRRHTVYPPRNRIFHALELTSPDSAQAVVLGQDPYHNEEQAHGLCFSVPRTVDPPPSLRNIFREREADLGLSPPGHGCLEAWGRRGVLLLNTVLTVRAHEPGSHRNRGWEAFTDGVIRVIAEKSERVVFALWGNPAKKKEPIVNRPPHALHKAPHPSPLSAYRGFFGSRPFSFINGKLREAGREPIDWSVPS